MFSRHLMRLVVDSSLDLLVKWLVTTTVHTITTFRSGANLGLFSIMFKFAKKKKKKKSKEKKKGKSKKIGRYLEENRMTSLFTLNECAMCIRSVRLLIN